MTPPHARVSRFPSLIQFVSKLVSLPGAHRARRWPPGNSDTDAAGPGWHKDVPVQPGRRAH